VPDRCHATHIHHSTVKVVGLAEYRARTGLSHNPSGSQPATSELVFRLAVYRCEAVQGMWMCWYGLALLHELCRDQHSAVRGAYMVRGCAGGCPGLRSMSGFVEAGRYLSSGAHVTLGSSARLLLPAMIGRRQWRWLLGA
jgi:hypothetical protein